MEPQQDWWQLFFKWLDLNKIVFIVTGLTWKFIDRFFGFLTKLIDGRLKKIADTVIAEKTQELDQKITKLDEKLDTLLMKSAIEKK